MDSYEIWVDLAPGVNDLEFVEAVQAYLGRFVESGMLETFRVRRRKLGFGPDGLGEFVLTLDFRDLTQLDQAFSQASTREGAVEQLHAAVYSKVRNFKAGLYRDFPDPWRKSS